MGFRFQARTLLQLGAELISSDAIALFELIKNASDAESPHVDVGVVVRLPQWPGDYHALLQAVEAGKEDHEKLRRKLLHDFDATAVQAEEWAVKVREATDAPTLCSLARTANYIRVADTGHGMSAKELDQIFLTVGTPHRLQQKLAEENDQGPRKIQGEKGLGRLAAMRLGDGLRVTTSQKGESHWNILKIDWTLFGRDLNQAVEDIDVAPEAGPRKDHRDEQGTRIRITNLKGHWDAKKLLNYATESLSRITDPFASKPLYRVNLRYNGEKIVPDRLDTDLLKIAHAVVEADFKVEGSPLEPKLCLRGTVRYQDGDQVKTNNFMYDDLTHLKSTISVAPSVAWSLGSFTVRGYWFNRQALRERKPDGPLLVKWVNAWSGGLMLFRDGFRVHPYGAPDDDWLSLDKKALASGGYKVNRRQLIGKVDITSKENPTLTDQTNREGLRECPEKEAFVALLQHVLERELRGFMNQVERQKRAVLDLDLEELTARAEQERDKLANNFELLKTTHPEIRKEKQIIAAMESAIGELESILTRTQVAADELNEGRSQLVHLAGLGLMVEMLAHELNRSTQYALGALEQSRATSAKGRLDTPFENLELHLKTMSKRLRTLDPATTSGRQRKETFDLVRLTQDVVEGHEAEFRRHRITCHVEAVSVPGKVMVKMVKGMVLQILENLMSNSLYWLKQHASVVDAFSPEIVIEIDADEHELRITDNGPGVLESIKPRLFTPFFTTKPPGLGKGLGLFIARDIAKYHDCTLELSDEQRIKKGRYNTFVLSLPRAEL